MVKPTLLAFHGSGSNSTIHTVQLARLARFLRPHFEIESLSAPIPSSPGPGILPFFEGCGPYYRWIPPNDALAAATATPGTGPANAPTTLALQTLLIDTVTRITSSGGKVVGLLGFSQGTRVVVGLLKAAQIRAALVDADGDPKDLEWLKDIKFGVSTCSSFPPPLVPASVLDAVAASGLDEGKQKEMLEAKIAMPTLHVLGNQDEWRWAGKLLVESAFGIDLENQGEVVKGKSGVYEFNMGHHYPVQPEDTKKVADWVLGTWEGVKNTV
ncbi:hypothetical protein BU23DRAFT_514983 [Bimuria novae-zelandiae CBS 107.79]|uniref:Serine hydrolase domain-containing protein n=1 Tax=Bimuria novae-zelandiae CBS 107.79 TaxID=1447943 RepID=A0A6A5USU3_9PLEO|nr:hypothetical protein BU23DRAFT_514983 [Bimuria novae-zelandiae CBS 107.79]